MDKYLDSLIYRHTFSTQDLVESYPPKLYNINKKVVHRLACPPGTTYNGEIEFSRWSEIELPETFIPAIHQTKLIEKPGYFTYQSSENSSEIAWYLNFADNDLFYAYGGPLFAQDEMQVAEHPALGSLREALLHQGIAPLTVENNQPTPILIRGVERRCAIATDCNIADGRPYGLYGNNFAQATPKAIEQATTVIHPPTISNIIAIEAPAGGYGQYTFAEIEYILATAYTGFLAAKIESELIHKSKIMINTGFWGCGAYGGNRILMALLQILAAHLSGIDYLVFHTGGSSGNEALKEASIILHELLEPNDLEVNVDDLIEAIDDMEFQWGVSDGN